MNRWKVGEKYYDNNYGVEWELVGLDGTKLEIKFEDVGSDKYFTRYVIAGKKYTMHLISPVSGEDRDCIWEIERGQLSRQYMQVCLYWWKDTDKPWGFDLNS